MNNREFEDLMHRVRPAPSSPARFHRAGQELLEEILRGDRNDDVPPDRIPALDLDDGPPARVMRPPRRAWPAAAAVAAAVVAVCVVLVQGRAPVAPADELPQEPIVATGNPYLTVDDRWRPASLVQNAPDEGEQQFTGEGDEKLTIWWGPESAYERTVKRIGADVSRRTSLTIFGQQAPLFETALSEQILVPAGEVFVSVRLDRPRDHEEFLSVLSSLRVVDPQQWIADLGEGTVTPGNSAATAATMLRGVPLPAGFDLPDPVTELSQDRYYFGAELLTTVSCAWLEEYTNARADRDEDGMAAVDRALSSHRDWPLLNEMNETGDWGAQVPIFAAKVSIRQDVSSYMEQLSCDLPRG
ncbi:hypothetical protein GCM10022223_16940 [Kineosporia mesophila]|uniref:Uncharacterized protein n=1 Tax=Kineosporia mesophila TaxID=566012 RepID=A0ABP6ZAC2_9ACTN|nr:hypothetical protein [Kineosporia mesophila]MCD5352067.1 hypothetical protein [Kineosporia mesophila]